ncbi:MAG: hypothetical protein AAF821_19245 [Cyanobacteria bacterium P01_D01_bin.156]
MTNRSIPLKLPDSDKTDVLLPERPRLYVDLRDADMLLSLKEQASRSGNTLRDYVNDALEHLLSQPPVFSVQLVENLERMNSVFKSLPMDQIDQLAQSSHRSPDQMLIHLLMKGIAAYTALNDADRD